MWFNEGVTTINRPIRKMTASQSPLRREIWGGKAPFDELHEGSVLEELNFLPYPIWNWQGKKAHNVSAQSVWFSKKTGSHCVIRAIQMQDYEYNERLFLGGHCRLSRISTWIDDAGQFRFRVHAFPQIAMLLRQLNEICHASCTSLKEERNPDQEEPCPERAGLNEGKPIVAHPAGEDHLCIIPVPRNVSPP